MSRDQKSTQILHFCLGIMVMDAEYRLEIGR